MTVGHLTNNCQTTNICTMNLESRCARIIALMIVALLLSTLL